MLKEHQQKNYLNKSKLFYLFQPKKQLKIKEIKQKPTDIIIKILSK